MSWPNTRRESGGGKVSKDRIMLTHMQTRSYAWAVSARTESDPSLTRCTGNRHEETATSCSQGNSNLIKVKNFQWQQLNSASCPEGVQWLQPYRSWKFTWMMLWARRWTVALLWAGAGNRWHLGSLARKIGLSPKIISFCDMTLKCSEIWANYQRTKALLAKTHTHTETYIYMCVPRIKQWGICCSLSFHTVPSHTRAEPSPAGGFDRLPE